jgi:hypothetical protein
VTFNANRLDKLLLWNWYLRAIAESGLNAAPLSYLQ